MPAEISTGKTVFILAAVVGCFAVLWPRLFHPMLQSALYEKTPLDNSAGCCDVISDMDVNAIKILTEMCGRIVTKHDELDPKFLLDFEQGKMSKEVVSTCKKEVLNTCGVDITSFLAEQVGLGQTYRQILENIKTFNNSVCLKQNFGLERGLLGAARHWSHSPLKHLRQERPPHMRPDLISAALRERGRAIPQSNVVPRIIEGRPGPIPGMRPPMGGAGHVVPPPKTSQGPLGILMPMYTIFIVMIFVYTMMKLMMRRSTEVENVNNFQSDPNFRQYVFAHQHGEQNGANKYRYDQPTKLVETAIAGLVSEVDRQRENVTKPAEQPSGKGENGVLVEPKKEADGEHESASVKVVNMEMTASCEGGKLWTGSRPSTPTSRSRPPSRPPTPLERETATIPVPQDAQEIYLEGALPSQSQLLVAESETETHKEEADETENTAGVVIPAALEQEQIGSTSVVTETSTPLVTDTEIDRKKKITFSYSDEEDDHQKKKDYHDYMDGDQLVEEDQISWKSDDTQVEDINENFSRFERLSSLDQEYLREEIEGIIDEAIEYVEQEYDLEQEYDTEQEGYCKGTSSEEVEYDDDNDSDIRKALKESETMRKAVHEQVEEVKSLMSSILPDSEETFNASQVDSKTIDASLVNVLNAEKKTIDGDTNNGLAVVKTDAEESGDEIDEDVEYIEEEEDLGEEVEDEEFEEEEEIEEEEEEREDAEEEVEEEDEEDEYEANTQNNISKEGVVTNDVGEASKNNGNGMNATGNGKGYEDDEELEDKELEEEETEEEEIEEEEEEEEEVEELDNEDNEEGVPDSGVVPSYSETEKK